MQHEVGLEVDTDDLSDEDRERMRREQDKKIFKKALLLLQEGGIHFLDENLFFLAKPQIHHRQ
jgi:hypothetical protein